MDTTKTARSTTAPTADQAETAEAADATTDRTTAPAAARPEADRAAGTDRAEEADEAADQAAEMDEADEADEADVEAESGDGGRSAGVGSGAGAVAAAGLALVALSGSWVSRVLAERQTLIGQIESVNATTTEAKIAALYGDAWHTTALVNGVLSALALLLAVFVLARPALAAADRALPAWVRAVSWAAVALGALGILLFGLMYFDLLVPVPKAA
ncbi:hypothetical protein ABZ924_25160 [Streptomyces sp. NPDC046876]|uniref:hypothetical protein n=1 Tax=Streptomyces sp. NPDC046876 TaxID=3155616 RepID=UPI0033D0FB2D